MIDIGNEVNIPIEITYWEMREAKKALDAALAKGVDTHGQRLTLDIDSLQEGVPETIQFSTSCFWGLWKVITRKEVVWTLTRSQAFRLRTALIRRMEKKHKGSLKVTEGWFKTATMF